MITSAQTRRLFPSKLDMSTGIPAYRQIIDAVLGGIASGTLQPGEQLPTVRQLAVDLSINPNTVVRAYRELEIRGILSTQQGMGTFITNKKVKADDGQRQRRIAQLVRDPQREPIQVDRRVTLVAEPPQGISDLFVRQRTTCNRTE